MAGIDIGPAAGLATARVDPYGRVHFPGGWRLTAGAQPVGRPLLTALDQPPSARRQQMQGDWPVVLSAFEAEGLRLSTEVWGFHWADLDGETAPPAGMGEWLAVQAVVFNSADEPLTGHFCWQVEPTTPAPLRLTYLAGVWLINSAPGPIFLPPPPGTTGPATRAPILIAPWEEAEFLAFCPLTPFRPRFSDWLRWWIAAMRGFRRQPSAKIQNPKSKIAYGLLKARVMSQAASQSLTPNP